MKKLVYLLFLLWLPLGVYAQSAEDIANNYVEAPYDYVVKKQSYKKRFGDITTSGRFLVLKIIFSNKDNHSHFIEYKCFYLTGSDGTEYEVHTEASIVRQTKFEDWKIKDLDVVGFNHKEINAHMNLTGFLVFEVPYKDEYKLNFRGYLK